MYTHRTLYSAIFHKNWGFTANVGALGIGPRLRAPKARVLPLYDAPPALPAYLFMKNPVTVSTHHYTLIYLFFKRLSPDLSSNESNGE